MSTVSAKSVKVRQGKNPYKTRSLKSALLKRETAKFISNANYLLNCGLTSVFLLAIGVAVLVFKDTVYNLINTLSAQYPFVSGLSILIVPAMLFFMLFTGGSATPSVSLEGKTLWVVRTLPVSSKDVLFAKEKFQLILHSIPALFFTVAVCIVLRLEYYSIIAEVAFTAAVTLFVAAFSLYLGIMKADVNWTNETAAIKSNIAVLFVMLTGFALMVALIGAYILLTFAFSVNVIAEIYISAFTVVFILLFFVLNAKIKTKGVKKFESL